MMSAKKQNNEKWYIALCVALVLTHAVFLAAGLSAALDWGSSLKLRIHGIYRGQPMVDVTVTEHMGFFVTEDGTGYMSVENDYTTHPMVQQLAHLERRPSAIRVHKGENGRIEAIYPFTDTSMLFVTDRDELFFVDVDHSTARRIATDVVFASRGSTIYGGEINVWCVSADGGLRRLDIADPEHPKAYTVCEGVKAAYEAHGTVYVLTTSGELCTLTDGNTLSAPLAEGVKDIRVTDTLSVAGEQELVNVLTNDGRVLAFGQYVHREDHAAYAITDTFVTVGEGVRSLALVPYGTLMLHEDGACTFYGFDPSDDAQKTIDTRTVDTTGSITAIGACESNLILRRADAIYLVGHTAVRLGRAFVGTDTFDSDPYLNHTGR